MALIEEYKSQNTWRHWESYLDKLPIKKDEVVLDLGCGPGYVTHLLAQRAGKVIGIDLNAELLNEAQRSYQGDTIQFITADIKDLTKLNLPPVDGIWTSFAAAYLPDFSPVLKNWLNLLKPNGWIAIVEMSDLFAHKPLEATIEDTFKAFYKRQLANNVYDFEMGGKVRQILLQEGVTIELDENKEDEELVFNGPADKQILTAWENRLNRMVALQDFFGKDRFQSAKSQFLNCLGSKEHYCEAEIKFIIGRK
ncbi:class I SAM-dependent methyltransferase [Telluribacter sp. SYSU D00476]|uniref:class I SAM-dependent methyltransferase n=1 Tax=Telluribacter sp. SYSU D00476 TaxID=2811430 RepID=UPI001FF44EAF|nr:class I SAM-dependent methyltransferase [Telluribacter sp. SYSU D00476]